MAITILNTPETYSSAFNENIFVVYEATKANDPVTYVGYKYVLDLYVNAVLVARLKAFPDPVYKYGLFNISDRIRSYLSTLQIPEITSSLQLANVPLNVSYQVKFGEEYGGTLYTNVTVDSARKAYSTYSKPPYSSSNLLSSYANKVISTRPTSITLNADTPSTGLLPIYVSSTSQTATLTSYINGVVDQTATINLTQNVNNAQIFNLSKARVIAYLTASSNITSAKFTFGGTTYEIKYDCVARYKAISIGWLSQFSFESYDFRFVSKVKGEIERNEIRGNNYKLNSDGTISFVTNGVYNTTSINYFNRVTERIMVNSDVVSDSTREWLTGILTSPLVYMLDANNVWIPCRVKDTSFDMKKVIVDGLLPMSFELEYSTYNSQIL